MDDEQTVIPTVDLERNEANKETVWSLWEALDHGGLVNAPTILSEACDPEVVFHGPAPIGDLRGIDDYVDRYLTPLLESFPDLRRDTFLFFGGASNGRVDGDLSKDGASWVTGTGNLYATFSRDFLGIPASGEAVDVWRLRIRVPAETPDEVVHVIDNNHQNVGTF